ncbi:MAG TPA: Re/Si-specific NAD(P)(+) transhydrogenase subunit alpha [Longimicrobiales bacterium]
MRVAVPKEIVGGERRVALTPEGVARLKEAGFDVRVGAGAGRAAGADDEAYREAGAAVVADPASLLSEADLVLKVRGPAYDEALGRHEADLIPAGATLIAMFHPLAHPELVRRLADRRITTFCMDLVPRITRAQKMDALSSQATAAGYKAALVAADRLTRFFPMLMTAAGTIPPARVLVLGAGVAGLQAIATARRLGAVVQAFDIRPAVKEQVESLGASFVGLALEEAETAGGYAKELDEEQHRREQELLHKLCREADAVITTALVPGRRAPVLITEAMVRDMRAGSVIVDLAAEMGGNCELTEPGREVLHHDVLVVGLDDAPAAVAVHASQMYSRNITALLLHLTHDGALRTDFEEDEIGRACLVTRDGAVVHEDARQRIAAGN